MGAKCNPGVDNMHKKTTFWRKDYDSPSVCTSCLVATKTYTPSDEWMRANSGREVKSSPIKRGISHALKRMTFRIPAILGTWDAKRESRLKESCRILDKRWAAQKALAQKDLAQRT